jgi:hypothetical protein
MSDWPLNCSDYSRLVTRLNTSELELDSFSCISTGTCSTSYADALLFSHVSVARTSFVAMAPYRHEDYVMWDYAFYFLSLPVAYAVFKSI